MIKVRPFESHSATFWRPINASLPSVIRQGGLPLKGNSVIGKSYFFCKMICWQLRSGCSIPLHGVSLVLFDEVGTVCRRSSIRAFQPTYRFSKIADKGLWMLAGPLRSARGVLPDLTKRHVTRDHLSSRPSPISPHASGGRNSPQDQRRLQHWPRVWSSGQ